MVNKCGLACRSRARTVATACSRPTREGSCAGKFVRFGTVVIAPVDLAATVLGGPALEGDIWRELLRTLSSRFARKGGRLALRADFSSGVSLRAPASRSTVLAYGARRAPRSRSAMPRTLSPARSARASWVRPTASASSPRSSRSSAPPLRTR